MVFRRGHWLTPCLCGSATPRLQPATPTRRTRRLFPALGLALLGRFGNIRAATFFPNLIALLRRLPFLTPFFNGSSTDFLDARFGFTQPSCLGCRHPSAHEKTLPNLIGSMKLRAWFDPKMNMGTDLCQFLTDREAVGDWHLRRVEQIKDKEIYAHAQTLLLVDGSEIDILVQCDWSFNESLTNISLSCAREPRLFTSTMGSSKISTVVPTGRGGSLSLEVIVNSFDRTA